MNYAETFEEFATRVGPTDLALYAGVGIVLWVLFKEKLSPIQKLLSNLVEKFKSFFLSKSTNPVAVVVPTIKPNLTTKEDIFFQLVISWKQTRDLASKCGCDEAVKVADQMFPYLSPVVCSKENNI